MALSESFKEFALEQFSELGEFDSKNMFGGVALLHNGKAFAKIKHNTIWLKGGEENIQKFRDLGMEQYSYGKKSSRKLNFYEAPADVIENPKQLAKWAKISMKIAENG